ncbi:MAG: DUF5658 family protein [Steroidobacteraceae bacterium]
MKELTRPSRNNDWVTRQLQGTAPPPPNFAAERRARADRRRRIWWSVWYGSFNPRRRTPPRRLDDSRFHALDWYAAHLLAVSVGILVLSAADAFLTVTLLFNGADEINPVMARALYRSAATFAAMKMSLTSVGVVLMVFLGRYRFMRMFRVDMGLYGILTIYLWLILFEMWMLNIAMDSPGL